MRLTIVLVIPPAMTLKGCVRMTRKSLPIRSLLLPLAIGGMFASSTLQAWARPDSVHLARIADRHYHMQQRLDDRQLRLAGRDNERHHRQHGQAIIQNIQALNQNTATAAVESDPHRRSEFLTDAGRLRNVSGGAELDLSSDSQCIKLGENLFKVVGSVTITVGGAEKTLKAGDLVTPAEYVAVTQQLGSGLQDLVVGSGGHATSGQVMLNVLSDAGRKIDATSLVIPENVVAIGDFANHGDFRVTGQLNNYGSVYALSTRDDVSEARIGARSIYNGSGALISSEASNSLAQQFGHLNQAVSLRIDAGDSLVNLGHISSSKDLTISANEVINAGGNISAKGSVTVNSASVDNWGSIASSGSDVNFTTLAPSAINIYNEGGRIEALNGAVNIRNSDFTEKLDTTLSGGDWLSKELNINGGEGIVKVNAGDVTGAVTGHAGSAFIEAHTPDLFIKDLVTTGDPVIKNTGDVTQGSLSTGGANLAIIAGGNINISFGAIISTNNGAGSAGNILMVSGAAFEDEFTPGHLGQTWITGGNSTGGNINAGSTLITANGTTNGGNITLIAFPGTLFAGGDITTSNIEAKGGAGGANGNVTVIGRSASVFSVDANGAGSTAGTGNVLISSWNAQVVSTVKVTDDGTAAAGTVVSGSFAPLTTTTADPDPSDAVVDSINIGGTFNFEAPDDCVVFGNVNANVVNITGSESVDLELGSSVHALTNVNIRAFGINDAPSSTIDDSFIFDVSTTNGNISIIQDRGVVNVRPGATINANEGNILLQSANLGGKKAKKFDKLNIGDNVTIFANASTPGLGKVTLATGAVPAIPSVGKPFKGVTFSETPPGQIFWGKKVTLSPLDNITVNANAANVVFSNLLKKKNFTIGSGVNITADALP